MTRYSPERYINTKVATGFILLLVVAVLSFGVNYFGVVRYMQVDKKEDFLGQRLMVLNELMFRMQEADGAARLYSLTGDQEDSETYQERTDSVLSTLGRLELFFPDSSFQAEVDTIRGLFFQKKEQTDQLIELSIINRYRRRYGEVLSILPDSINYQISQITYSSLHLDSTRNKVDSLQEKNETFFGRIASYLTEQAEDPPPLKTPEIEQKVDSSLIIRKRKDPALEEVKKQLLKLDKQDKRFAMVLLNREKKLVEVANKLTNTIREIVRYLENQALIESATRQQEMNQMRDDLLKRLVFLGVSALLIILGFVLWIGRDLRKSKQLKNQLVRSREEVESLMKVKERFLANMSHEIRTPLTSIIGFSELQKEKDPSAEVIHNSAVHLLALVNDVLDISRLEAGKLTIHSEHVDPGELMQEVWQTFKHKTNEKNLAFTYFSDENLPAFKADKTRLRQVLFNLINNAIKFTDQGKIEVGVFRENELIIFEVRDTGCGIPENRRETIFEEFSQMSENTAGTRQGTGLGLAISKKLVEAMGGEIQVESKEGAGSTFRFSIPYVESLAKSGDIEQSTKNIDRKSLLVVDDDPLVGRLLKGFLKDRSSIMSSESPEEALMLMHRHQFDLIITDFRMPGMNGLAFIEKARSRHTGPILVLSAGISSEDLMQLEHFEKVYQMTKPFSREDMENKLQSVLDTQNANPIQESPSKKTCSSSLTDLSGVVAFTGDDKDFLNSVVSAFIEDTDENIETLTLLIKNHDQAQISEKAHKMLTGFRQFGISEGIEILKEIETTEKREINQREIKRLLKRLKELWQQVKADLQKQMEK
ncbi:MAG: ATP-binding protein [Marinilabiliaceae bacterium]